MAPKSFAKKASENWREVNNKAKATTKSAQQKVSKTLKKTADHFKKTPSAVEPKKTSPVVKFKKPIPPSEPEDEFENASANEDHSDYEKEPVSNSEDEMLDVNAETTDAVPTIEQDDEEESNSFAADLAAAGIMYENDIVKAPNVTLKERDENGRWFKAQVYRDPEWINRAMFPTSTLFNADRKEKASRIHNARVAIAELAKKQASTTAWQLSLEDGDKQKETPEKNIARLEKARLDTLRANKKLELALVKETFGTFEFVQEAQSEHMQTWELEFRKRFEVIGYGRPVGLKDDKENSGFCCTTDPFTLRGYLQSQHYDLDLVTGLLKTDAQKKADQIKAAKEAATDQEEVAKVKQHFTNDAGFVATPPPGKSTYHGCTTQTAYGTEDVSSVLQAWLNMADGELTMLVINAHDGCRSVALYAGNKHEQSKGATMDPEAYQSDDKAAEDIQDANKKSVEQELDDPSVASSELMFGNAAVEAKLNSFDWDEDQIAVVTQQGARNGNAALIVARDVDALPITIDFSLAAGTLTRYLQLAQNRADVQNPVKQFADRVTSIYEDHMTEQGVTVHYEPDQTPFLAYARWEKKWAKKRKGDEPDTESDIEADFLAGVGPPPKKKMRAAGDTEEEAEQKPVANAKGKKRGRTVEEDEFDADETTSGPSKKRRVNKQKAANSKQKNALKPKHKKMTKKQQQEIVKKLRETLKAAQETMKEQAKVDGQKWDAMSTEELEALAYPTRPRLEAKSKAPETFLSKTGKLLREADLRGKGEAPVDRSDGEESEEE